MAGDISYTRGRTDIGICRSKGADQLTVRIFEFSRMQLTVEARRDYCEMLTSLKTRYGTSAVVPPTKDSWGQQLDCDGSIATRRIN